MHKFTLIAIFFGLTMLNCSNINPPAPKFLRSKESRSLQLDRIKLPAGFKIEVFAEKIVNARSLCLTPGGTLFVGTRDKGNVYALRDTDGDMRADKQYTIATGLNMPNGVAFRDGALFVAEVNRILRFDQIESKLANPPAPVVVYDKYPTDRHHGWKYIAFGPDGKLYVPVGAPCNICEPEEIYASLTRINPDGSGLEIVQHGIRNTVGFTWHPVTKELWFTDNGRDLLGDDRPPCELNVATEQGQHFGYPYCHGGNDPDPEFAADRKCEEFVAPLQNMAAHVAPLGLQFYTGDKFPAEYKGAVFIAEHGSWNRSIPQGYRITVVKFDEQGNALPWEVFAEGWLRRTLAWGRPVDILMQDDGSMLVSDDKAGVIYRIAYTG